MKLDFTLVDVFSDRPFGGNQLAVFPRADGLAEETMQQLAREFNFAETTFVLPPSDPAHSCRVRIFTPRSELPFAGHPTVGTAAVLASFSDARSADGYVFEEGIGPVSVTVDDGITRLHLRSPDCETSDDAPDTAAIAAALTLPENAVVRAWYAGVGLRFCFAQVAGADLVDQAVLDKTAWKTGIADGWSPHIYVFAGECRDGAHLYARFFAPAIGIDEDAATGSAAATLAASLAASSPRPDDSFRLHIDQGVAMGRPSMIEAAASKLGGRLAEVSVGGRTAIVGSGVMTLGDLP
jgi:trans-2,3-dihydro-3-hydroxyanthranilate isomerase